MLGTGKTLCLLTSSLAWKQQQKTNTTTIIYTSRTHSQLTQAMGELKNSEYNNVKSVALGSRDQLCINTDIREKGTERNNLCHLKLRNKECNFRDNVDISNAEVTDVLIKDIEDLVTIGKKCTSCPYYLAREIAKTTYVDIIFLPYNYLLDRRILKNFDINLSNSVVIFDEAHNIEKVCEESASINFTCIDIKNCINDITHAIKNNNNVDLVNVYDSILTLKTEVDKIDHVDEKGNIYF